MKLTDEQKQALRDLRIHPGWEALKLKINENISVIMMGLENQQFQSFQQIGDMQGQIKAFRCLINFVEKEEK